MIPFLLQLTLAGALLIGAALGLERLLGRLGTSAAARHRLLVASVQASLVVAVLGVALPNRMPRVAVLPVRAATAEELLSTHALPATAGSPAPAATTPTDGPLSLVLWTWLAVAAVRMLRTTLGCTRLCAGVRTLPAFAPTASSREAAPVRALGGRLGVPRPDVREGAVASPATIGRTIVLPHDARSWHPRELRVALAHELAHVRRGDFSVHVGLRLLQDLLWFHPLVHLAVARACLLRELATDELASAALGGELDYAEGLVELAAHLGGREPRLAPGVLGRGDLGRRVDALLKAPGRRPALPPRRAALALTTLVLSTPLAALDMRGRVEDLHTSAVLWRFLDSEDAGVRLAAIRGLEELGERKSFERLLPHLREEAPELRAQAIRSLGAIACDPSYAAVVAGLRDEHPSVRVAAADSLLRYRPGLIRRAPARVAHTWGSRSRAALGRWIGRDWERSSAEELLRSIANADPSPAARSAASRTLARLGS